jgi:hypothetical protein
MTKTITTKEFQTAKALAAQEYFSIVLPHIKIPESKKIDQEFTGKILKKRTSQK